jgi:8-oxo-dGTP diphosphatase
MKISEQGFNPNRYKVIIRTLIFIFYNDEILLLKGAVDKKIWANLFNGIGGHVEPGEDINSAAQRELLEETGIKCDSLKQNGTIIIDLNNSEGILIHIFSGKVQSKNLISSKEGELHWIPINQVNNFPLVEDLFEIIPMVMDPKINYISGFYQYDNEKLVMRFNNIICC